MTGGVLDELANLPEITILHIIYQQKAYEGHAKDYEFSGTSMREHWQSGYEDTRRTLKRQQDNCNRTSKRAYITT